MTATREAGDLIPDDLIQVEHDKHQHLEGALHCGDWCVDAVVDSRQLIVGRLVKPLVAFEWHTEDGICGVTVVDVDARIPYRGHRHQQADAA